MIYVDSNIPIYLTGKDHPNKTKVIEITQQLFGSKEKLVTSSETFQEIIHCYKARSDTQHMHITYEALQDIVDKTYPVYKQDVDQCRNLVSRYPQLSSRDCLHLSMMEKIQCDKIWTFDTGFQSVPNITCFA